MATILSLTVAQVYTYSQDVTLHLSGGEIDRKESHDREGSDGAAASNLHSHFRRVASKARNFEGNHGRQEWRTRLNIGGGKAAPGVLQRGAIGVRKSTLGPNRFPGEDSRESGRKAAAFASRMDPGCLLLPAGCRAICKYRPNGNFL